MPCIVVLLVLLAPRVVLVALWLLTDYLSRAYDGFILPLLGFFFMPITTLADAWVQNDMGGRVEGLGLVLIIVAVLLDFGALGFGERHRRRTL